MSSLAFTNLNVRYGRKVVVHDFPDIVRPGEWLCLFGPNGAGQSSVLRAALACHTGMATFAEAHVSDKDA